MSFNEGDLVLVSHYKEQNFQNIPGVLLKELKRVGSHFTTYEIFVDGKIAHYESLNWVVKSFVNEENEG